MELRSKTIIITGASSGIGAAAAELFASEGANVVLGARREQELSDLAARINQSTAQDAGRAVYLAGDVSGAGYCQALVDHAVEAFGALHGAFNNAGIMGAAGPVPEMDAAAWRSVIEVNLTSAFLSAKAQIPALRAAGGGAMVFTSSFVGNSNGGLPGMAAYAASKAGLNGLVLSLAAEHAAEGIRANALMPGGTLTAMAGDDPQIHAFISGLHPMRRMAQPGEIAQAALFLLSDRASFITGAPVLADGGLSARLG